MHYALDFKAADMVAAISGAQKRNIGYAAYASLSAFSGLAAQAEGILPETAFQKEELLRRKKKRDMG